MCEPRLETAVRAERVCVTGPIALNPALTPHAGIPPIRHRGPQSTPKNPVADHLKNYWDYRTGAPIT
jgi:hypothetical protein